MKMAVVLVWCSRPVILRSALDLGARGQRGHGVDDDDVQGARGDEHVHDLQGLLAGVRLADQQGVRVHPELAGVDRVQGVLRVDEGRDAAVALRVGHRVQGQGGLARGLRAVDLHHAAARQAADAQGHVHGHRARGDDLDGCLGLVPQPHDGTLAELLVDLGESGLEGLLAIRHLAHPSPLALVVLPRTLERPPRSCP